ncbi:hypothetical protein N9Y68_05395 [Luminiphilus sp.]|nr:hypothetical protein [Luminiphilus sp.]
MDIGILVLGYRRPESFKDAIASVSNVIGRENFPIYAVIDGPKDSDQKLKQDNLAVVQIARGLLDEGKVHSILVREKNFGTMRNVFESVTMVLAIHEYVLVVEDDLMVMSTGPAPLQEWFAQLGGGVSAFSLYANKISGVTPFLSRRFSSQAWGTSRYYWNEFRPDTLKTLKLSWSARFSLSKHVGGDMPQAFRNYQMDKVDSWAIPWNVHNFLQGRKMLYPPVSLVVSNSHLPGAERTEGIIFDSVLSSEAFNLASEEFRINGSYLRHYTLRARLGRRIRMWCRRYFRQ